MALLPASLRIARAAHNPQAGSQTPRGAPRRSDKALVDAARARHLHDAEDRLTLAHFVLAAVRRSPRGDAGLVLARALRAEGVARAEHPRAVAVALRVQVAQQLQHLRCVAARPQHDHDVRGLRFWVARRAERVVRWQEVQDAEGRGEAEEQEG